MAVFGRCDIQNFVQLMFDSSSEDSSSEEDIAQLLVHEVIFPPKPIRHGRLSLESLSELDCERLFRFQASDIERLTAALGLSSVYRCRQGTRATGTEALLIMLRRLSYPARWCDLVPLFGMEEPELSSIFNRVIDDVYDKFKDLLTELDLVWLNPELFSAAVAAKGAALSNCWGFIDGTVRPIARPKRNQRIMFSGHKRIHCIKFQAVVAPNGLVAHMFGPIEGRRHDAFMLGASGLAPKLRQFQQTNGQPYIIYGDPAYGLSANILAPFRGANLSRQQRDFNKSMSQVRISVEWAFGKICQYFSYVDFKRNSKVLLQPVAKYYLVATLLTNCHTCLYGSLTTTFFGVDPPSLETYLNNY
jgi:hypothetical protein